MSPILEQFLAEARENLLFLDKNLDNLENGDSEDINALFRAAHTLKGSSGLAGFDSVKEYTHIAEDLLDAYRNNKVEFSSTLLDALYDMFDEVTELIDAAEESGDVASVDDQKLEEFKTLRQNILNIQEQEEDQLNTDIIICDDEIPTFSNLLENDFTAMESVKIDFSPSIVTAESFEQMNYYLLDLDLSEDILEFGNDPFYSLYLLEEENIISMGVQVAKECESIKQNPIEWSTRIVALVYSSQELLEDAFYNFLEEVTIYPLSIQSLLSSDLQLQSNESIFDFLNDLENTNDIESFKKNINTVKEIVNPNSKQGFIFNRLDSLFQTANIKDTDMNSLIEFILVELDLKKPSQEDQSNDGFNLDLEEKEVKVLNSILTQQKNILQNVQNENVQTQVKSVLTKLETNLNQNFALDIISDTQGLKNLVDQLLNSLATQYDHLITPQEDTQLVSESKDEFQSEPEKKSDQKLDKKSDKEKSAQPQKSTGKKEKKTSKPIAKTVKVDLNDIDSMMDIVGEMLVIKNSLPYIADALNVDNVETSKRDLITRYDEINRVTTLLQEKVMEMRLLSLSFIFDRYPKLVRDISKSLNKKINYEEDGADTKLDKTVIEKLADPLIHIIRNSLDHGIEDPQTREEKGKSPEGTISIKAQSVGDKVYVEIKDDGKGIDVDKVVQRSLEKKMVDPDALDTMSREEKLLLVFHPGVSTMEQISELSGRGVGMDVVRKSIDDVGGKISIKSEVDVGTAITLELPMSVALSNVFHVKLGKSNYALAMDSIKETVEVPVKEIEYINDNPMLKLRGSLIPLVFNYKLLSKDIDKKENYSLLILQTQDTQFGFVVDKFVNQLDIVQKPLTGNLENHPFISGTSLLGNGEVLFVLNPSKLINLKEKK